MSLPLGGAAPAPSAAAPVEPKQPKQPKPTRAPKQPKAKASARPVRRGRRVTRVVRRIELWSVLKLSIVLLFCLYVALLLALVFIWNVAYQTGQIERLQSFLGDVGLENWRFYGDRMFKACMAIGAVGVLAGTVLSVLVTALVNLVSEITGGIRFSVIEEDPRPASRP